MTLPMCKGMTGTTEIMTGDYARLDASKIRSVGRAFLASEVADIPVCYLRQVGDADGCVREVL